MRREHLARMKPGAVLVDVAIDQGRFETSKPTTHADPTYIVDGIVHYCVANMPGAVACTSTFALNNATLPFALALADKGWRQACSDDPHLLAGLNVHAGRYAARPSPRRSGYPHHAAAEVVQNRPWGLSSRSTTPVSERAESATETTAKGRWSRCALFGCRARLPSASTATLICSASSRM